VQVSEALTLWIGPAHRRAGDAVAIFLAAGFTMSCYGGAPRFNHYVPVLKNRLDGAPIHAALTARLANTPAKELQVTDLIEVFDRAFGRRAVVDAMLAEPSPGACAYVERASRPGGRRLPPRVESTYRTLADWRRVIAIHRASHLAPLRAGNPAVLIGRLVADGILQTLLTTNWDAYAELGCELVGLAIRPAHGDAAGWCVQLYDRPEAAALRTRLAGNPLLLKLHGSVDRIHEIISARGRLPYEVERDLREAFLVASSDLVHWRGTSQWVQDAVADGLRAHKTLFLGASGADPVSFRAVRDRIVEWEQRHDTAHDRSLRSRQPPGSRPDELVPDRPPVLAVGPAPDERLHAMFAVVRRAVPSFQVVDAYGGPFLRATYAWSLLQRIVTPLVTREDGPLVDRLCDHLRAECDQATGPLIGLLCDAVGPGLRWSALSEGETTLADLLPGALHYHHYAPWREAAWRQPFATDHLRTIARALDALAASGCVVDARSALVVVPPPDRSRRMTGLRGHSLLLLPWARQAGRGLSSARLRMELGATDGLLRTRPSAWSITANAAVVPVPALLGAPQTMRVSDARLPVVTVATSEWIEWSES